MSISAPICETEKIAAFIDGDLDPAELAILEEHLAHCVRCTSELQAQQLFMCELNSALASQVELAVPANFARVVAVHAESDMRGVRDRKEHTKALRFCIILGLAAFALLGVASSKAVILSVRSVAAKVFGGLGIFARTIFDAAAGLTKVSRILSHGLISDSRLSGIVGLFLVILAIAVLSLLISRYHRARVVE